MAPAEKHAARGANAVKGIKKDEDTDKDGSLLEEALERGGEQYVDERPIAGDPTTKEGE